MGVDGCSWSSNFLPIDPIQQRGLFAVWFSVGTLNMGSVLAGQVTNAASGATVQLLNPNGVQLVTQTHFKRAADKRFGEPEELIEDNWEYCRGLKGIWSPCTNDYDEKFGKTFVRAAVATGVWTHGGGVTSPAGTAKLVNGNDMHSDLCPPVTCERADVNRLHIYHFRSPSMEDAAKKSKDWAELQSALFTEDGQTDEMYEQATFFFNQIRDISMARFGKQLMRQVSELLTTTP